MEAGELDQALAADDWQFIHQYVDPVAGVFPPVVKPGKLVGSAGIKREADLGLEYIDPGINRRGQDGYCRSARTAVFKGL